MQQATQAAKKMADAGGDSHFLEEQMNPTRIKQYLDSGKDYDKVKGMKWLLAMMSKGRRLRVLLRRREERRREECGGEEDGVHVPQSLL